MYALYYNIFAIKHQLTTNGRKTSFITWNFFITSYHNLKWIIFFIKEEKIVKSLTYQTRNYFCSKASYQENFDWKIKDSPSILEDTFSDSVRRVCIDYHPPDAYSNSLFAPKKKRRSVLCQPSGNYSMAIIKFHKKAYPIVYSTDIIIIIKLKMWLIVHATNYNKQFNI